jgi:hypothetical protein
MINLDYILLNGLVERGSVMTNYEEVLEIPKPIQLIQDGSVCRECFGCTGTLKL